MLFRLVVILQGMLLCGQGALAEEIYQRPEAFVAESFAGSPPDPDILWLTGDVSERVRAITGRAPDRLRMRYWEREGRSVWILDEIGKVKPITAGFVVNRGRIEQVRVLIYRESHGWEVRYPAFSDQFANLELDEETELSRDIDGISGATLSVNALRRMARLALVFDAAIRTDELP